MVNGGWFVVDGGWFVVDGGWFVVNGELWMVDGFDVGGLTEASVMSGSTEASTSDFDN